MRVSTIDVIFVSNVKANGYLQINLRKKLSNISAAEKSVLVE